MTSSSKLHPRAYFLFFIQIFSTLSFSIIYSTLTLYTSKGLGLAPSKALAITGSFVAFNYFLHLLSGYIGGRFLSYRVLFCSGMIAQTLGCLVLSSISFESLFWGLAIFLMGCGMNITCINYMLTEVFEPHDKRRESAFLWNYSGMNIGFFIGFTISGIFQITQNYHSLFIIASLSNIIALMTVLLFWRFFKDQATALSSYSPSKQRVLRIPGFLFIGILILFLRWLLEHSHLSSDLILLFGAMMFVLIVAFALKQQSSEASKKIWAFFILILASTVFWTLYQMGPLGLILFISHNIDRTVHHFTIPPQWIADINTLVIIFGGPCMAFINQKLRSKGYTIRLSFQFTLALFLIGSAFAILPLGIFFANPEGQTHLAWILCTYGLLSLGELFISPIGYAMIGQLIPQKLQGLMMGTWLMSTGVAATISNYFSQFVFHNQSNTTPLNTNGSFSLTFSILGYSAIGAGCVLWILSPFLNRLIQAKERSDDLIHPYNAD